MDTASPERQFKRMLARILSISVILAIAFPLAAVAYADSPSSGGEQRSGTIIVVNTSEDLVAADDGACSLREAILAANTNTPSGDVSGECPAGKEEWKDIITLAAGATYSLTRDGSGEDEAISGDLDVWDNAAGTDLIIGVAGGEAAIISQDASPDDRVLDILGATVNIEGLTLTGGTTGTEEAGGAVQNTGFLTVDASAISGNSAYWGGGIANWGGTVKINATTVLGNHGQEAGGGILNDGTLKLDASIISENSTDAGGGGIWNDGVLKIAASTFSANRASGGGGLFNEGGTVRISDHTEFLGNMAYNDGGGIFNTSTGTLKLTDSTVSANTATGGGGLTNLGTATLGRSQVTGNTVTWAGGGISNGNTGTLMLVSSTITGNSSDALAGGIMNQGTLTVNNSEIKANTDRFGGGGINNEGELTIDNSVLSANSSGQGGALYNSGTATIRNGTLVGGAAAEDANIATDGGGGLFNLGVLIVDGSTVSGNWAPFGGGLFNWTGGRLTVTNSLVSNNSANEGGGLHNKEDSITDIRNGSIISDNYAEWTGGGLDNWGTLIVTESALLGNTSLGEGDAISSGVNVENATSITGSCIVGNGDTAVFNSLPAIQNATGNWWGDATGPSGLGPGSGDSVGGNIDFSFWLDTAPAICQ